MTIASIPPDDSTPAVSAPSVQAVPEPLVGRDSELETLLALLTRNGPAIINVTGTRGVGKSALIRAALERASSRFAEVAHLDLTGETPATALAGLDRRLARLPIPMRRGELSSVAEPPLVTLDRADVLAHSVPDLLDLVPHDTVRLVVESVPELRDPRIAVVDIGPLGSDAAEELFRRRVRAMGIALDHDERTTAYIGRICTAVEANPLAIELAAARLSAMPLAALATALESPPRATALLAVALPNAAHGRTPHAGLSDSHPPTSATSQRLLDMLSVFSGSFTIEAVEAIWDGDTGECFDALSELVDLRLVQLDTTATEGRYRLNRLVLHFAARRIAGSDTEEAARLRHAGHYCSVARRAAGAYDDADEDSARAILGEDYPEALSAVRWLRERDPARALRLAADLGWEAHRRGGGAGLVEALEALTRTEYPEATSARRDALLWLAQLQSWSPLGADRVGLIRRQLSEAGELAHRLGEPLPLLRALRVQFLSMAAHGDLQSGAAACREAIEVATRIGHARWLGRFEISLAAVHGLLRQYDVAVPLASSGLARAIRSGDRRGMALAALALRGMPAEHVGTWGGVPSLETVLEVVREQGDLQNEVHTLAALAQEAVERGEARQAASWILERQNRLGRTDLVNGLTVSVMLTVHVARLRGDADVSARLHGAVASHMEPLLAIMARRHAELYLSGLADLRNTLGSDAFDAAVSGGRVLDREQTLVELVTYVREAVAEPTQAPAAGAAPSSVTEQNSRRGSLTPREDQVLRLLAKGLRNKEIAVELGVSPKSVMHYTGAIYRRLGVRSRTEAVTAAARAGIIAIE